jgi:uncharacterized protein with FMN-binding domain
MIGVAAAVIILLIVGGGFLLAQNKNSAPAVQDSTQTSNSVGNSNTPSAYKDGTYTAEGDYITHGGPESISVTVTLKDGVIELADVKSQARDQMSTLMQGKFISGYKPLVEGKNIDEVSLTNVSGSSLTPIGFEDALSKIKAQASS